MVELSIIILSKTSSDYSFKTTMNCIDSLFSSMLTPNTIKFEVVLVESNPDYLKEGYVYPKEVKVVIPNEDFGFHKFLNIGINNSVGRKVALCNNDLIFKPNWYYEIQKVALANPSITSFSPIDPRKEMGRFKGEFELGYKVTTHVKGWCLVIERSSVEKINFLDEKFEFYYSDNDYALSLLFYNIKNAVVSKSHVEHLHRVSTNESKKNKDPFFSKDISQFKIPKYLYHDDLKWILKDERVLKDHLIYYEKWGNPNSTYRIARYSVKLNEWKLNIVTRILFLIKRKFKI